MYLCGVKRLILFIVLLAVAPGLRAQRAAHPPVSLSAGLSVGTTGPAVEVSVLLQNSFGLRAGFNWLDVGVSLPVQLPEDIGGDGTPIGFKAQLNLTHGYLLGDIYPIPDSRFHLTGGLWVGSPVFVRLYNTGTLPEALNSIGIDVDGYSVHAIDGNLSAELRVNAAKPYLGVGFGRPRVDRRWTVSFDAGILWWGNPGLFAVGYNLLDEAKEVQLTSAVLDGLDKGILDKVNHIPVWPVLKCTVYYRIF